MASTAGAQAYVAFFEATLLPELRAIEGFRRALVLRREAGEHVAITVLTFWASMEAVARFAGPSIDRAVVEPEARAALLSFDERVEHHAVALDAAP